VGVVAGGFGADGFQHGTGYAHFVHDGGRFSDDSSGGGAGLGAGGWIRTFGETQLGHF
jgi:hypothetical protein